MKLVFLTFSLLLILNTNSAFAQTSQQAIRQDLKMLNYGIDIFANFNICRNGKNPTDVVDFKRAINQNQDALDDLERVSLKLIDEAIALDQVRMAQLIQIAETAISKEAYSQILQEAEDSLNLAFMNRRRLSVEINRLREHNTEISQEEIANKDLLWLPSNRESIMALRENLCSKIAVFNTVAKMLVEVYTEWPASDVDRLSTTVHGALEGSVIREVAVPIYKLDGTLLDQNLFSIRFDVELIKKVFGDQNRKALHFQVQQAALDKVPLINQLPTEDVRFSGEKIFIQYNQSKTKVTYPSRQQIENVLFLMLGIKDNNLRLYNNNK